MIPLRYAAALMSIFLTVPLLALEIILWMNAPWWRLPTRLLTIWMGSAFVLLLPFVIALWQGRKWALGGLRFIGLAWFMASLVLLAKKGTPGFAFFVVGQAAYWTLLLGWLRFEMQQSCLDPQMAWFEGTPQVIPGLSAQLRSSAGQEISFRVCRIDRQGAFFVADSSIAPHTVQGNSSRLNGELIYDDGGQDKARKVVVTGKVTRRLMGLGLGLRFQGLNLDQRKDLGDLVERVNTNGY